MKNSTIRKGAGRGGFALVVVLGMVVLIVGILVAFLLMAGTERTASGGFVAALSARNVGEAAVSLVKVQINSATTQGTNTAWASQPGMVRTFDASGKLRNTYKLYSSSTMVGTDAAVAEDAIDTEWAKKPALWVDLNSPMEAGGVQHFPILDPRLITTGSGVPAVEGFTLGTAPGATTFQKVPMPVRWLYMLEDGKLVAAEANTGNTVKVPGATRDNPIVGRVAFWADDETAKVNVNTASEGTFWDAPHGYTNTEVYEMARKQPVKGEYQRYPGHPAMVSLSPILPGLSLAEYLDISPMYRFGGSEGGTKMLNQVTGALSRKSERLYASVDDIRFAPDRDENPVATDLVESRRFFLTAHSRAPETTLFNTPRIAVWPVQQYTGDLDDQLRDPTLDWKNRTNAFDRLIAFCASAETSTGLQPYFFQRAKAYEPGHDLLQIPRNMELYGYLQKLTEEAIPGFGGNFKAKYSYTNERDSILTQIFDYVRCASTYDDQLDVGLPNSELGKYTFTKSILREDWVSPGNNKYGGEPGHGWIAPVHGPNKTQGQGRFHTLRQLDFIFIANADGAKKGDGSANDSNKIVGADRNYMLNEPFPAGPPVQLEENQMRVQAMVIPELFSTMMGRRFLRANLTVEIEGLERMQLFTTNGVQNLGFPASAWIYVKGDTHSYTGGAQTGAELDYRSATHYKTAKGADYPIANGADNYSFISRPVTIAKSGIMYTQLSGDPKLTVKLYAGAGPVPDRLIQTFEMEYPLTRSPLPTLNSADTNPQRYWSCFSDGALRDNPLLNYGRARTIGQNANVTKKEVISPLQTADVVRTLVPKVDPANLATSLHGDYRIVSATQEDGGNPLFAQYPGTSGGSGTTQLSNLRAAYGGKKLLQSGKMDNSSIPVESTGWPIDATGDFDIGTGAYNKGAFANKPDEGEAQISTDGAAYFNRNASTPNGPTFFSPNRTMPSPVMFGSLPTGVMERKPWRTLLFRPLAAKESAHIGATAPHDDLLLDLFWMPVVEPYAISDRLSTAGKINMNYRIMPFSYINRASSLHALFKAERVNRIPLSDPYLEEITSAGLAGNPPNAGEYRLEIDPEQTLKQFDQRFDGTEGGDRRMFISPSEICEVYLVPKGKTFSTKGAMATDWDAFRQTGDNHRERPYATLYPRLTTKSNTYTVHFRAQALKASPTLTDGLWDPSRGAVLGEYRGSSTVERFINPDAQVPDYAAQSNPLSVTALDAYYKWRVISHKQFAP
jgi:uncharacterized protein (TIGR02600 family)